MWTRCCSVGFFQPSICTNLGCRFLVCCPASSEHTVCCGTTNYTNTQVAISSEKSYADRPEVSRIASANGSWDHLAVNKMAKQPMGTGTAPPPPLRSSSSLRNVSIASRRSSAATARSDSHAVRDSAHNRDGVPPNGKDIV